MSKRNSGCRISDEYTYQGLRVVVMENEKLRISILLDKGSDIFEFLYKPQDIDFMWRSPMGVVNPTTHIPSSAGIEGSFLDYYEGGWQEILPSGGFHSTYKGAEFGLHGEVSNIPWQTVILEDTEKRITAKFWVRTYRTPFYLEKYLTLEQDKAVLFIKEILVNEGEEEMEFMWGHHPALGESLLSEDCRIDIPARKVIVDSLVPPSSRFHPKDEFSWPIGRGKNGEEVDLSKIPPPSAKVSDMVFVTDLKEGWYGVTNQKRKVGFAMRWDRQLFPYIWYWQVYKGDFGYPFYGRTYNIALEPFTSYPRLGLAEAINHNTQKKIGPGMSIETELLALAYEGVAGIKGITEEGDVKR